MLARLQSFLRAFLGRRSFESAMAEELRFHTEAYAADLVRGGMAPDEALRRARAELGAVDAVKLDCREARGLAPADELRQAVGYALRRLRAAPAFTTAVVATLAVCLGANLTVFALVDAVLVRALPLRDADRLVVLYNHYAKEDKRDGASLANFYERRGRLPAFAQMAMLDPVSAIVGEGAATSSVAIGRVSADFFATLGVTPRLGRAFDEKEMTYQTDAVAILSDEFWRSRYDADPAVLGRRLRVDGLDKEIVGVLPAGFRFLSSRAQVYTPLSSDARERSADLRLWGGRLLIARLAKEATLREAQAQLDAHDASIAAEFPYQQDALAAGVHTIVAPLRDDHVAGIKPALILVQAGVLCLLAIGCVNFANLLLVRASGRSKELAVRRALGARTRHIVLETAAETLVLAFAGAALGLAVAAGGVRLLTTLGVDQLPLGADVRLDARVMAAAVLGAVVAALACAIPVAWINLRSGISPALRSESRGGTSGPSTRRLRHGFVVAQLAMALVLLAGAGLLKASLDRAASIAPGFRPDHVIAGHVSLPWKGYESNDRRYRFTDRVLDVAAEEPGVLAVGVVSDVPMRHNRNMGNVHLVGTAPGRGLGTIHDFYGVNGDYFAAIGIVLRAGRFLDASDSRRDEHVAVIDDVFALRYWPGRNAVGEEFFLGRDHDEGERPYRVVGVVGRIKQAELTERAGDGAAYFPFAQFPFNSKDFFVVARTRQDPGAFAPTLARLVRRVDVDMPIEDVRAMDVRVSDSLTWRRSPALLTTLFAAVAVLLAAIGTYGVLSYAVAQQRREIAVRVALGASPWHIRAQFVRLGARLFAAGTALGLLGAWAAARGMRAVLFGVSGLQPSTAIAALALLALVVLAACTIPSRRATTVSPLEALAE